MIPNYADVRAVFQAENGTMYTLPVAAWSDKGEAAVPCDDGVLHVAETLQGFQWLERDLRRPNGGQQTFEKALNPTA